MTVMKKNYIDFLQKHQLRFAFDELFLFVHRISELYFNARKDTIYCDEEKNFERISAIRCAKILLETFNILLAPILPFTSEEIFQYCKEIFSYDQFSIHEFSEKNIENFNFENVEIKSLEILMEKIRKMIEIPKQEGRFSKNTDLIIFVDEKISQPFDVLAKLLGVLEVKSADKLGFEILDKNSCLRCGKKVLISSEICERCSKFV